MIIILILITLKTLAQDNICINKVTRHNIHSKYLTENREYWVSLPYKYSDSLKYPVIYVFDAEWRFDLIKNIAFDLGANNKIQRSIIVGIPHVDSKNKRGRNLTFSHSKIGYNGKKVSSSRYDDTNSGGGMKFYKYLTEELMADVNKNYSTNNHETLIGHSYGGYFGGYILSLDNPFEVIHIYDPSIWFSNGEVIESLKKTINKKKIKVHLTYQSKPDFHRGKIEEFIKELLQNKNIILTKEFYKNDTHNSLFLDSFYKGIISTNSYK